MADCKPTGKTDQLAGENLSSMSNILRLLSSAFKLVERPSTPIPPFILLLGAKKRPGISSRNRTANAIARIEAEADIPMGDVFADGPNRTAKKLLIEQEELDFDFGNNGGVQSVIPPGAIQITVATPTGPMQGSNLLPVTSDGIIKVG